VSVDPLAFPVLPTHVCAVDSIPIAGQEGQSHDAGVEAKALAVLKRMNPDDVALPITMTVCVRCQLTTNFELENDDEEDTPSEWTSHKEEDWVFLHFRSLLNDFDWKIVKFLTEDEFEKSEE
jgi:hypothetical protein